MEAPVRPRARDGNFQAFAHEGQVAAQPVEAVGEGGGTFEAVDRLFDLFDLFQQLLETFGGDRLVGFAFEAQERAAAGMINIGDKLLLKTTPTLAAAGKGRGDGAASRGPAGCHAVTLMLGCTARKWLKTSGRTFNKHVLEHSFSPKIFVVSASRRGNFVEVKTRRLRIDLYASLT